MISVLKLKQKPNVYALVDVFVDDYETENSVEIDDDGYIKDYLTSEFRFVFTPPEDGIPRWWMNPVPRRGGVRFDFARKIRPGELKIWDNA